MGELATTRSYVVKSNIKFNFRQLSAKMSGIVTTSNDEGSIIQILSGFNNAVTFTMRCDSRRISVNLFCNGTIQIAGPQTLDTAVKCLGFIKSVLQKMSDFPIEKCNFIISSVMCNFNFELGFVLDEMQLVTYINEKTETEQFIAFLHHKNTVICACPVVLDSETVSIWDGKVVKEKVVDLDKKKKLVTFFVFRTGKVVVTGKNEHVINPIKKKFISLVEKLIEERPWVKCILEEKSSKKHTYKEIKIFKFAEKQYVLAKGTKTYINHRTKELQKKYPDLCEVYSCSSNTSNVIEELNKLKLTKDITKAKISISLQEHFTETMFLEKLKHF